jgi:hypothetical protein
MAYEYDIFISYRRQADTHLWITKHFAPRLQARVELELEPKPAINHQISGPRSEPRLTRTSKDK